MLTDIKLVILDRDGVINTDSPDYIKSADEFKPLPGSLEAIAAMKKSGLIITVATNQSGLGRGYFTQEALDAMHEKLRILLAERGGSIDSLHYCPHAPEEHCDCRKPKSGLIKQILSQYPKIKASQTLMVGDSLRDLEAAWAENCQAVLVLTGKGASTLKKHSTTLKDTLVFDDLASVAKFLNV